MPKLTEHYLELQGRPDSKVMLDLERRQPIIPPGFIKAYMIASGALDYGLSFYGEITSITSSTIFVASGLAGMGNNFFKPTAGDPYEIYMAQADGAAPEGQHKPVTAYTTATGTFGHDAFTDGNPEVGDKILLIHPWLARLLDLYTDWKDGGRLDLLIDAITAYVDCLPAALGDIVTKNEAGVVDAVWDEVLTAAAHNVATSAGRRLRSLENVLVIREETCAGGGNDTVTLDSEASAVDNLYINDIIVLTSGTGSIQARHIDAYVGGTKVATVNRNWDSANPVDGTKYSIMASSTVHVHGLTTEAKAEIEAECEDALSDYGAALEATLATVDGIVDDIKVLVAAKVMGRLQIATTTEDLNQVAGTYDLFTGDTQAVVLEKLNVKMPTGDAGGSVTSIAIVTDDATAGTIINATDGAVANLTSEADLGWTGTLLINVGTKIRLTLAGGAHGSEYLTTIIAQYRAVVSGGYLS